jgi:hypothetical protein
VTDADAVEQRLNDGWLPSKSRPHTWARGAQREWGGEDWVEILNDAELEDMTPGEEQALIERRWTSD